MKAVERFRLRITFTKTGPARWIGHLDLSRTWERALNRAKIPMVYTQGFNRRPRMQFASALPLGYTSRNEVVDLWVTEPIDPEQAKKQLAASMAPGIAVLSAESVPVKQPSLPTLSVEAQYDCKLTHIEIEAGELQTRIDTLMGKEKLMWGKAGRKNKGKQYDMRPLIYEIALHDETPLLIKLRLSSLEGATGRPGHVIEALGLDPLDAHIERTLLVLTDDAKV